MPGLLSARRDLTAAYAKFVDTPKDSQWNSLVERAKNYRKLWEARQKARG